VHVLANPSLVRVVLSEPMAVAWGQRFLMMQRGGSRILGGGSIVWFGPTERKSRNRLSEAFQEAQGPPGDFLRLEIRVNGAARRSGDQAESLKGEPDLAVLAPWVFDAAELTSHRKTILSQLSRTAPVGRDDLAEKTGLAREPLQVILDDLMRHGAIVLGGSGLQLAGAGAESDLSSFARRVLDDLIAEGGSGMERGKLKTPGTLKELRNLVRLELAVSLNGDIYYAKETYDSLVERITAGLEVGSSFSIGQARERTGLSRKYLIPLLNRMESAGIVRRDGDLRTVLDRPRG
jgi:selenocysteine-specific elongation factor